MRTRGRVSRDALEQMLHVLRLQPDQNVVVQYVDYLGHMFTGNWGRSIGQTLGEPVTKLDRRRPAWTLGLVGITTVLAFVLGTLIGTIAGWRRGGALDAILPPIFVVTSALPYFWVGLLLILVFSQGTGGLLPANFNYDTSIVPGFSPGFVGSVLAHAVLPAATLLITTIGGWILTMRNNMITTLAGTTSAWPAPRASAAAASCTPTPPATRSCPTSPASRCPSASSSPAPSSSSTSSTTRASATSSTTPSRTSTTR